MDNLSSILFFRKLGFTRKPVGIPSYLHTTKFHQTSKTPPQIQVGFKRNALYFSVGDLLALPESLSTSIKVVGGPWLTNCMNVVLKATKVIPELQYLINIVPSNNLRKLSAFPDKELKTRVIAIGDYYSQTALIPLHKFLFKILKRIPQDMTFDQGGFTEAIKDKEIFYSLDLTAATDRFPIDVIYLVLSGHLPKVYLDAWKDIMVGYPFKFPQKDLTLSYSVGNPMGFYSSWASFALAHHFILYVACARIKME